MTTPDDAHARDSRKKIAAFVIIGLLSIALCVLGLAFLFGPMPAAPEPWCVVASLDRVPLHGEPKMFPVMLSQRNAWEMTPPQLVGSVFLRRQRGTGNVVALSSVGPWLGCPTVYDKKQECFRCPCHHEEYDLDGRRIGSNPAPRDLDTLDVAVRNDKVLVKWQEYQSGITGRIPIE